MPRYRVEWVERSDSPSEHRRHVTGIGTVDADGGTRHWGDIADVRAAMANGDSFFTQLSAETLVSPLESFDCPCGNETIRSAIGYPSGHNLDNVMAGPVRPNR